MTILAGILALPIRLYQLVISPLWPAQCRFSPTCSAYGLQALREHGALKGLLLTLKRMARCHPWGGQGHDPVPEQPLKLMELNRMFGTAKSPRKRPANANDSSLKQGEKEKIYAKH